MEQRTRTYDLGGGRYTAVQNEDRTWNVLDVPICGEIPKDAKFNAKDIDKAWLEGAVAKHQARLKNDNFRPPLHLEHHEVAQKTERAGEFVPQRIGRLSLNGKPMWAVFADLIRIPEHIFNRIEKGELPYLSVEVEKWEAGEFASLALMDDDAPFFRFPNLTIGNKIQATTAVAEKFAEPVGPALAFAATPTGALILCKLSGGVKLNDDDTEKKYGEEKPDTSDKDEDGKGKKKEGDKEEPPAQSDDVKTLLKQILTAVTALARAQSGVGAAPEDTDKDSKTPVDQEPPMSDPKDKAKANEDLAVKLAAMQAKVDTLTEKDTNRDRKEEVRLRVEKAEAALKGWHISDLTKKSIALFAAEGQKQIDAYIESFKANTPKDPPPSFESFAGVPVGGGETADPEIEKVRTKYLSQSPEVIERVNRAIALYDRVKRTGMSAGLDRFVEAQLFAARGEYATANGRSH